MAFDFLQERFSNMFKRFKGKTKIKEKDIDDMLREIRISLLEADVNFKVIRSFLSNVKEKAIGAKIIEGLDPGQMFLDIVRDELTFILGGSDEDQALNLNKNGLTVIMFAGLQGTGKTTSCAKLALMLRKKFKKRPFFIACDVYRPAAIDQLATLAKSIDIPIYADYNEKNVCKIYKKGLEEALKVGSDVVIVDTAGRIHIDTDLMSELQELEKVCMPHETLLTLDAMSGQDTVNVALEFNKCIKITGAVLTKMDGDARGGSALSVKALTNIPIKLYSNGEHVDQMEIFYPERLAKRILGMGDVLSLIDTVKDNIDEDEMMTMQERLLSDNFNYNDLLDQLKMVKRLGSISRILGFIPGLSKVKQAMQGFDESYFDRIKIICSSMTKEERRKPQLIEESATRRKRIALGSGYDVSDVNRLRDSLKQMKDMLKKMKGLDENDLKDMQSKMQRGDFSSFQSTKQKKGKGKNKGGFRY